MARLDSYTPDNLFAGNVQPVVTEKIEVAPNQNLSRGEIFELNVDGQAVTATDPTKAYGIMAETVVTTTATQLSVAYMTGEFNDKAVIVDGGSVATYKVELRKLGIFIKSAVRA